MKLVIGLSGRMGSGKSEISTYLAKNYGASQHRFSQVLMDILERLHITPEREALQRMGATLRTEFDKDVLVKAFEADLEKDAHDIIVVDGIRYLNEVEMLRGFENSTLFFVTAPEAIRYERIKKRSEKGEGDITFEEFKEADQRETERHLDVVSTEADHLLDNSGGKDELYKNIDKIIKDFGL